MSLFPMNAGQARARLVQAGAAFVAAALVAGCGSTYRPVITPISPSGPAPQPAAFAVAVSIPSPTASGVATVIDYAGDTIMAQAPIGPNPQTFSINHNGSGANSLNSDGTMTYFPVSTTLQEKQISYSTLPLSTVPVSIYTPTAGVWVADVNGNLVDVLTGAPASFKIAIPVAPTPVMIVGPGYVSDRNYAISQNTTGTSADVAVPYGMACNTDPSGVAQNGEADALEVSTYTVSARIPLGKCPVYGVASTDGQRIFILNRGSDTVTVINSNTNKLDACTPFTNQVGRTVTCHPTLPLSTTAVQDTGITPPNGTSGMTATAGPVYAVYNAAKSQLVVANYDASTITVIDVSLDQYGDDSATFGTTFTVPVGNNPASVTVLNDGSRAYTANQSDGTVSVVNLSSHTVQKTLTVVGHPRTVVSTSNSLYGKVYVASPDSPYLSVIRTDQDIVGTTILVQGNVMDVRVSNEDGVRYTFDNSSRRPGAGQPCFLPPALMVSTYGANYTLADCQTMPY